MKSAIFKTLFLSLCIVANTTFLYAQTASILPPGYTQYLDNNGKPLTSGKVYNYIPSTTTLKTTWQDSGEAVANTNPVILDAGGRAKILGSGAYRQKVFDRNNNLIWDAATSSTGSGSTSTTSTGDGDLVGTIKPWAGMTAPNQYAFTYGQEISRTTYATLFTAITSSQAAFCNSGSPTLNGLGDTTNFWVGMSLEISCVAAGFSTVVSKTSTTVVMAANANVTANTTAVFFPWGRGNGTTTFNLPDFRGFTIVGNSIMGGVASSNLSVGFLLATPDSSGAAGGNQSTTLGTANLPAQTPVGTITNGAITSTPQVSGSPAWAGTSSSNYGAGGSAAPSGTIGAMNVTSTQATSTFTGTAFAGQIATPFSRIQPSKTANYIIKITPDTNSATASGVTSLGGMVGDIACGTGLLCTGNNISITTVNITASNVSFTQNGTGAVGVTFDNLYRTIIVTPEMYGDGVPCSTASSAGIQKAINYLASISSRGTVQLANCTYTVTGPVTISSDGIMIRGYNSAFSRGTQISFVASASGQCAITVANGASIVSNTSIQNLTVTTSNTATYKVGICASDASVITIRDVYIRNWTGGPVGTITNAVDNGAGEIRLTVAGASTNFSDGWAVAVANVVGTTEANSGWPIIVSGANTIDLKGSTFTNAYISGGTITASSVGIQTKGRELFQIEDTSISADLPLRISVNPNFSTNALDETHFTNMTLATAISTNCVVMADTATYLTSVKFLGTQSWGGGKDGFCWRDKTGAAISQQLRFDNIRAEQKTVAGGTYFNIQPGSTLYSLQVINPLMGDRDGFLLRNVANVQIDNANYLNATGKCIDVTSTVQNIQINGSYWIAGSTATLTGQTLVMSSGKNPSTGCLAPFAVYANAAIGSQLGTPAAAVLTNATGLPVAGVIGPTGGGTQCLQVNNTGVITGTGGACGGGGASSITIGTTTVASGTVGRVLYDNAGVVGEYTITGTPGSVVMSVSPTLTGTTTLATLAATTINAFTLAGTVAGGGNQINNVSIGTTTPLAGAFTSLAYSTSLIGTSANANCITAGLNGSTNPVLKVDCSTASQAAGLSLTGAATGGTVALTAIDSGSNTNITINAKGSGTIGIGSVSTGAVTITPATTLSNALTYGGITLANSVTGTGSMVLSASPTLTGTLNAAAIAATSTITVTGAMTSGTNAASGSTFANGPNSGAAAGSSFVSQIAGVSNIGMGNVSKLITGGAFDGAPAIYLGSTAGVYVASTIATIFLGANYIQTVALAIASLPSCASGTKGARAMVTDSNAAVTAGIGAIVAAGGANNVPVTCDGTNWRIG